MHALHRKTINLRSVCGGIVLSAALLGLTARSALAEEIRWNQPAGGSFNLPGNWLPPRVPLPDDNAIFGLGEDPAYDVTFYGSVTNDQCIFRTDKVNMDLNGFTYTLDYPGWGLIVGESAGNVAEIALVGGILESEAVHIGLWGDSSGTLDLNWGLMVNVTGGLVVANDGDGLLTMHNGAEVTAGSATIGGHDFGNTGVLNISGASTTLTVSGEMQVGHYGSGTLNVTNGAQVKTLDPGGSIFMGFEPGSQGQVLVDGASTLTAEQASTNVGGSGLGSLTITNGGQVHAGGELSVGWRPGSVGDVTVSGAGSSLEAASRMTIGSSGSGTMQVDSGASVAGDDWFWMGADPAGTGVVEVTGSDSTVTLSGGMQVGHCGSGTLNVTNGAQVKTLDPAGSINIGFETGSQGQVLVDGASTLTAEQASTAVGGFGQGSLTITNGGQVHTGGELAVGWRPGSVGDVTVSGAGSTLEAPWLKVGIEGSGTMQVDSGASVTGDNCRVGAGASSIGAMDVLGPDSSLTLTYEVRIGDLGDGTLNVTNGAQVKTLDPGGWIKAGAAEGSHGEILVDGGGSLLDAEAAPILVGGGGQGSLTITNGAQVHSGGDPSLFVAQGPGSVGDVTVRGAGSSFEAATWMTVGNSGSGTMEVVDGGSVTADYYCGLGGQADGAGVIDVTGPGSTLTVTEGGLLVGSQGNGALNVTDGAQVAVLPGAFIQAGGLLEGSYGDILVEGTGSLLDGWLKIGDNGNGTLTIQRGASATGSSAELGIAATGNGSVTVTGTDSSLSLSDGMNVGLWGSGTLSIEQGGQVSTTNNIGVGWMDGSTGSVTVTGQNSSVTTEGTLALGDGGDGTMSIQDSATVTAHGAVVGWAPTGTGELTMTGADSSLTVNDGISIGQQGQGTMNVESGATLTVTNGLWVATENIGTLTIDSGASGSAGFASIGHFAGSDGHLTVTGDNSTLAANNELKVGEDGHGTLNVTDGASVTADSSLVGVNVGGTGLVEVTGLDSTVTLTGNARIGDAGDGMLSLSDGAEMQAGGEFRMGVFPDSVGDVWVSGAGSSLEAASWMTVGGSGSGTMQIDSGASVTAGYYCGLGAQADSTGVVDVTGPGSTLTVTEGLYMGGSGNGTLNVTDGAHVATLAGRIQVGALEGSQGQTLVDGSGSLLDSEAQPIVVGDGGQGSLSVTNGARVHSLGELFVGNATDSVGEVLVSGSGSTYQSDSGYASLIGNEGEGTLTIEDGGSVQTNDGLIIGHQAQLGGTVTVSEAESTLKVHWLLVSNKSPGSLSIGAGARVAVGDVDPQTIPGGELHIGPNGLLKGNGSIYCGEVVNLAGVVDPGGADDPVPTPGSLDITQGGFEQQAGGKLLIEIGGTQRGIEYSALDVSDDVTLDGELEIRIVNGFEPQLGDTFEIMTFASHTGEFATIRGQDLGNGLFCAVFYRDTDVTIVVSECIDIANFKPKGRKGKIKFSMDTTLPDRQKVTVTATNTNTGEEFPKKKKAKKGRVRSKIKNLAAGKYDVCVTETPNCGQGCFEKDTVRVK